VRFARHGFGQAAGDEALADASRQCQTFLGQRRRSLDVAQPQDVCAKQPERTSDTRLIIELAPKVERSLGQTRRHGVLGLPGGQLARRLQGSGSGSWGRGAREVEERRQVGAPLVHVVTRVPETHQGGGQPQPVIGVFLLPLPPERRAQVVVLDLQPVQPTCLVGAS
jgi:hypothetical protein